MFMSTYSEKKIGSYLVPFLIFKPLKSHALVGNVKLKKRPFIIYLRILPKSTYPTLDFLLFYFLKDNNLF
jgi:hypothetical protein